MEVKKITCKEFRSHIGKYFARELDGIQKARFDHHYKACEDCKKMADREGAKIIEVEKGLNESKGNCLSDNIVEEYVKDRLTPDERKVVDKHLYLDDCTECNLRIDTYRQLVERKKK